jgi:hypothetical protein
LPTTLWQVASQQIGEVEEFRSEREMEAFLMSNEVLLVGSSEEDDAPRRLWSQLPITKGTGEPGRVDLVGLVAAEASATWELRLFELKKTADAKSVRQIREYLDGWNTASQNLTGATGYVKDFIRNIVSEGEVDGLLNSLRGTLVASRFEEDALVAALIQPRIAAVKLTKFRGSADSSFIFIEDLVGKAVQTARTNLSWADDGISESDIVVANVPNLSGQIFAHPDKDSVGTPGQKPVRRKKLVLQPESATEIVTQKEKIAEWVGHFTGSYQNRILNSLDELAARKDAPLFLMHATALVFALADYQREDYWVTPTAYWKLQRSGETLWEIESRLKKA